MKWREFILLVGVAVAAWPLVASAQPAKARRVMLLGDAPYWQAFHRRLAELGYMEGKDVVFDVFAVRGRTAPPALAARLVHRGIDAIVASSSIRGGLAASRATSTIPIVIVRMADPVGLGLVKSLARPGGNVTGFNTQSAELTAKRLELIKEVSPSVSRVVVIGRAASGAFKLSLAQALAAASKFGLSVQGVGMELGHQDRAFAAIMKLRPEAMVVAPGFVDEAGVVDFAIRNHLPTIAIDHEFADAGGLLSYGPSYASLFRRAAVDLDKILRGTRPADLPVEQPTEYELVVNLRTARALGITIPQPILLRADKVID